MDEKQAVRRLKQGDIGGLEYLVHCHQVRAVRENYPHLRGFAAEFSDDTDFE